MADFAGGDGTEANPYQITAHEHLNNIRNYLNDEDMYFIMMNDIDLTEECAEGGTYWNNGEGWEPIGSSNSFQGNFNGDNHVINGLYLDRESDLQGLFGYLGGSAIIANLGVTNISVSGGSWVGGLAGSCRGQIQNSYWNTETSGLTGGLNGEGRTTEEMTYPYASNTYVDWDFAEIWVADPDHSVNNGYPYLSGVPVDTEDEALIPISGLNLSSYPNPFNPRTTITFFLSHPGETTIEIYNVKGQKLTTLLSEYMPAGDHQIAWNGTDSRGYLVSSGVYFTRLVTNEKQEIVKMILMK